ncbi:MAG: hypothetical protein A2W03_14230 [Candidatus Aminicenantes bacterium RBG_16_63_16]|nr:MAG: hypothetical protein A2W03_14230 [Candidatus Aminicenantes bacterium RBG_16_63_16]
MACWGILPFFLAGSLVLGTAACFRVQPLVGTVPPAVESVEGYASWRLARDGVSSKSRFSFLIVLPDRGRIEISDPLNRTAARLVLEGETAYLVLPGKHVYWEAGRSEVMTRLLGFDITPAELSSLLSGRAEELSGWRLEADDGGRFVGGRREGLEFSVREFIDGGRIPRTVSFSNGTDQGSLRIIRLRFNQPPREGALRLSFLEDERFRAVGWSEIEKLLKNED